MVARVGRHYAMERDEEGKSQDWELEKEKGGYGGWRFSEGCSLHGHFIPSQALFGVGNSPGCADPIPD